MDTRAGVSLGSQRQNVPLLTESGGGGHWTKVLEPPSNFAGTETDTQ